MSRTYAITLPEIRFWKKVNIGKEDECWEWQAGILKCGYGSFYNEKTVYAHRFSFEISNPGIDISSGNICHTCDNTICVNPKHLFLGTHSDNMKDMYSKGRATDNTGENHGNSKLKEYEVLEIKKLFKLEYKNIEIAKIYNVSRQTIQGIRANRKWRYLNDIEIL